LDCDINPVDSGLCEYSVRSEQLTNRSTLVRVRHPPRSRRSPPQTEPADPAEGAFLTAITIAQSQKARSFELRAALALAKLYRATGREADAHAVLGPALEGFAPTPEFPEIAEALEMLTTLEASARS
jgi:hypothetical protein